MRLHFFSLLILTSLVFPTVLHGQDKPKGLAEFNEFAEKPIDGWNWDDDERLADLILQLREKESSLQALDARIAKATGRKAGAKMNENIAWRNNNRMDLNGGGPIRWDAFYGRNAEKFFYHPVDPNTTYHTNTLLRQVEPTKAGGVPGNQGTPAHQRPPQFDFIYRGWDAEQQRAKEKAEELKGQVDQMVSRRSDLERDVVLLWCKLAFRIMDKEKLSEKPVLRWAAIPDDPDKPEAVERAAALTTATQLLATALLFNDVAVEEDAPKTFGTVGAVIKKSRKAFEDGLLESATLLDESEDVATPLGKYKRLSRKLEDVSKSLTEGYNGWQDGDRNDDEPAKYASLRRIQDSVVSYSQILLSLNELVALMKKGWGTKFNPKSTEFVPTWDVVYEPREARKPVVTPTDHQKVTRDQIQGEWLTIWAEENAQVLSADTVRQEQRQVSIRGNTLRMERTKGGKKGIYEGALQINPETNSFNWSGNGPNGKSVEWLGIIALEGNELHLCFRVNNDGTATPPRSFGTKDFKSPNATVFYKLRRNQ